jgi:hypothetical protein
MAAIASGLGVARLDEAGERGVKELLVPQSSEPQPELGAILRQTVDAILEPDSERMRNVPVGG